MQQTAGWWLAIAEETLDYREVWSEICWLWHGRRALENMLMTRLHALLDVDTVSRPLRTSCHIKKIHGDRNDRGMLKIVVHVPLGFVDVCLWSAYNACTPWEARERPPMGCDGTCTPLFIYIPLHSVPLCLGAA